MENKFKLIASDLDGTLLTNEKEISKYSQEIINSYIDEKHYFIPCTGRAYMAINEWLRDNPAIRYYICTNGSVIYDKYLDQAVKVFDIDIKVLEEIEAMLPAESSLEIVTNGYLYTQNLIDIYEYGIEKYLKYHYYKTRRIVPSVRDFAVENNSLIEKIHIIFKHEDELENVYEQLKKRGDLVIYRTPAKVLEITDIRATKGDAIKYLSRKLGLKEEDVMCFGDQENDISMFKNFEHAVAMANAPEHIRSLAKWQTDNNNHDGVAKHIVAYANA